MTERMVAAIEHPLVDAIGHPTGRKIETRPPYALDIERVIEAAARTGTMLEINAAPDRRDLNEIHARAAAEAGVPILIDSDAHSVRNLELLRYGRRDRAPRLAHAASRSPTRARGRSSRRCASARGCGSAGGAVSAGGAPAPANVNPGWAGGRAGRGVENVGRRRRRATDRR